MTTLLSQSNDYDSLNLKNFKLRLIAQQINRAAN